MRRSPLLPLLVMLAVALALGTCAPIVRAQSQAAPCSAPEYHQFDFWVGDWDVKTPDGKPAGTNSITRPLGDCVLQEHWIGAKGGRGESYNIYDRVGGHWHQVWVDRTGTYLARGRPGRERDGAPEHRAHDRGQAGDRPHHLDAERRWHGAPALGAVERRRQDLDDAVRRHLQAPQSVEVSPTGVTPRPSGRTLGAHHDPRSAVHAFPLLLTLLLALASVAAAPAP